MWGEGALAVYLEELHALVRLYFYEALEEPPSPRLCVVSGRRDGEVMVDPIVLSVFGMVCIGPARCDDKREALAALTSINAIESKLPLAIRRASHEVFENVGERCELFVHQCMTFWLDGLMRNPASMMRLTI